MVRVSRRAIMVGGAAGVGLTLSLGGLGKLVAAAKSAQIESPFDGWLSIGTDGSITFRTLSCDMGQGSQTGVAQIIAEEMDADWAIVRVEMAPVEDKFFVRYDEYYTGGSQSIKDSYQALRELGAKARAMLVSAAAQRWSVPPQSCRTERSKVIHDGKKLSANYAELTVDAAKLPLPKTVELKPRAQWKIIGQPLARFDLPEKVDGSAIFGIDYAVPGALVGTIAQCPVRGGKLNSVDKAPAMAIAGVKHVVTLDDAVVVVANSFWSARKALDTLKPKWDFGSGAALNSPSFLATLEKNIDAPDSGIYLAEGEVESTLREANTKAFAEAQKIVTATYRAPFLSHSPIEPMNATARVTAGGCEIWAPTQAQSELRKEVAAALGLSPSKVRVHTTKIGGGFGRRLKVDYAVYAARTAQKIGGPVKLIWTREEDTQHGFYRPASAMRLRAALDKTGSVTAIETRGATNNDTAFGGIARIPYEVPSLLTYQKRVETHLPYGSWRATDRTQNMFFLESFIDEVALATKTDPLAFRKKLVANNPRNLRILDRVATMSNWGKPKPGRHLGMAFTSGYGGTRVAQVAEISVDAKRNLRVHKIWCAFDCGTTVNPNAVKAQIEGGILMGLSAALAEQITIKNGAVEQGLFDTYPILRMSQAPEIEIQLLESENEPVGGVGEPPLPPLAPAIANAIFAATGERIRELPFIKAGFVVD